jgi:hypothetical protein
MNATDCSDRPRLLATARDRLTAAIAARGELAAALQRPAQKNGLSHTRSRLRDLDLRLQVADIHGELAERAAQATCLDEAARIAATLVPLDPARARNLFGQLGDVALAAGDPAAAAAHGDTMRTHVGDDPRSMCVAGHLYARAAGASRDAAFVASAGDRAVACLRTAITGGAMPREALGAECYDVLRDRADFVALLGQ